MRFDLAASSSKDRFRIKRFKSKALARKFHPILPKFVLANRATGFSCEFGTLQHFGLDGFKIFKIAQLLLWRFCLVIFDEDAKEITLFAP